MILDSSALVAILRSEADGPRLTGLVTAATRIVVPVHVLLEASMVLAGRLGPKAVEVIDAYLLEIEAEILPFTAAHAEAARQAFLTYGKGRHPAGLNFGDCMSYAVARVEGLPLLYVGNDFAQTDIAAA